MNRQITTFKLGDLFLGVNILLVKEVYRYKAITSIPGASEHLCGLMNLRGKIVTVVDLNVCLNRGPTPNKNECRLLILKTEEEVMAVNSRSRPDHIHWGDDIVGFLIDSMDDVLEIDHRDILPSPSNLARMDENLMDGVVKQGDRLMIILDVPAVLDLAMGAGGGDI